MNTVAIAGVMNGFLQALEDKPAHAFATPCGQNLAGGEDYLAPLQQAGLATYIRDARTLPGSVQATSFGDTSDAEMIRWVENTRRAGLGRRRVPPCGRRLPERV